MAASSPTDDAAAEALAEFLDQSGSHSPIPLISHTPYRFHSSIPSQRSSPLPLHAKTPISRLKAADGGNTSLSALNYVASPLTVAPTLSATIQTRNGSPFTFKLPKLPFDVDPHGDADDQAWGRIMEQDEEGGLPSQGLVDFDEGNPFASQFISPVMTKPSQAAASLGVPRMPQTPTKSPQTKSAPSTISRKHYRSVTGLGTPSTVRSGAMKRHLTQEPGSNPVSPTAVRRRVNSSQTFLTNVPLSRNVSSASIYSVPGQQDRNVSGMTSLTASTSYELRSPTVGPYVPELHPSHPLPGLVPGHHPSPQPSQGYSPLYTPLQPGGAFFDSPDPSQGIFAAQQGEISLMQGMNQIMAPTHPAPNTTSMLSVASFPGTSGMRQQPLGTIMETPSLAQDTTVVYTQVSSAPMASQARFQNVEYPVVPAARPQSFSAHLPSEAQPIDVNSWVERTHESRKDMANSIPPQYSFTPQGESVQYFQPSLQVPAQSHPTQRVLHVQSVPQFTHDPQVGPSMQTHHAEVYRHTSGSYPWDHAGPSSQPLSAPLMSARSVSAPGFSLDHGSSAMPVISEIDLSLVQPGGLFGPIQTGHPLASQSQPGLEIDTSHMTPYSYPPEPSSATMSPETPRKRKTYPRVGNPLRPGPKPKPKTPKKSRDGSQGSNSPGAGGEEPNVFAATTLARIDEDGPIEQPSVAIASDAAPTAMQREASSTSSMATPTVMLEQPQVVVHPPPAALGPDQAISGLSRDILEKLYMTYMAVEDGRPPQKRFKCMIEGCDRSFPRKSAIHSHIQTHLEDKPFRCDAEDCGAAFVRLHDLRRHTRIHSGTKPFPCPCGKGFARGDALHRHRQRGICIGAIVPRRTSGSPPRYEPY
ncbi:hypothetical protein DB88DRAFT_49556 [Papiliotrema laurentii]|uniref:C2H2-type domain-containing protein n=1 Tax=Papiliotrema laurentii TaxID=5418 RepID=A0AAD9L930_PAPLA|nr:hypothetical protein DB88DRAFT_49556 [Papiliotrema laurentii]